MYKLDMMVERFEETGLHLYQDLARIVRKKYGAQLSYLPFVKSQLRMDIEAADLLPGNEFQASMLEYSILVGIGHRYIIDVYNLRNIDFLPNFFDGLDLMR